MISPAELTAMQAVANSAMDTTITISRVTSSTRGPTGAIIPGMPTTQTVTGNAAQPTPTQLQNYGYKIDAVDAWLIRVPVGTDIRIGDTVTWSGHSAEVQIPLDKHSYQTSLQVLVAELHEQQ